VVAFAAVETTGAQTAFLEIYARSRTGKGHYGRASRRAPCRRAPRGRRVQPASRTDNPRLRLRETSKARQLIKVVLASHDTPPWIGGSSTFRVGGAYRAPRTADPLGDAAHVPPACAAVTPPARW
jgi:hypothetical protein